MVATSKDPGVEHLNVRSGHMIIRPVSLVTLLEDEADATGGIGSHGGPHACRVRGGLVASLRS